MGRLRGWDCACGRDSARRRVESEQGARQLKESLLQLLDLQLRIQCEALTSEAVRNLKSVEANA